MSWDRQQHRLSCDHRQYVQSPGTTGAKDGHYVQCPDFVEALTAKQARAAAREMHWQRHSRPADYCPLHARRPRQRLRREDYLPVRDRR